MFLVSRILFLYYLKSGFILLIIRKIDKWKVGKLIFFIRKCVFYDVFFLFNFDI